MWKYILIFFFLFSCTLSKADKEIAKFETILGENETQALNLLVSDFEINLNYMYSELPIEKQYRNYLTDMISESTTDWEKFKFQKEATNTLFNQSGLRNEIYVKDSRRGLEVNGTGKYMQALYAVKDSDSLLKKYWDTRAAAGIISNEFFVNGILSMDPDFNNYFHKRIVVLEFSF